MKEGLLKKVQTYGHWRVNFRPVRHLAQPLTLPRCRELVQESAVSIRGWDFPHLNYRNDDEGGHSNGDGFIEQWTDWWGMVEFWRMYKSSQFLSYLTLREDTKPEEHGNPDVRVLNTVGTIYSITEFVEFLHRLYTHGIFEGGVQLSIELRNTKDRVLTAGQFRIPFWEQFSTAAESLKLERRLDPHQLGSEYRDLVPELCSQLFGDFGWSPARSQIEADVDRFYRREFSY